LLSKVPCGLSQSHKWKFLVLLTTSGVKWATTLQLLQTEQLLQIGPMCMYTVWHFRLRIGSGIKPWSTDLNSESLAKHYTQKDCIRTISSAFSILNLRTSVTGWNCAVGLILTPIWFITFCSLTRPTQGEHERRTTPVNSQHCKKHQQHCSAS
jgi:hypothetical protein